MIGAISLQSKPTVYLGRILNPTIDGSWEDFPEGCLVVDSDGKIIACGPRHITSNLIGKETQISEIDFGSRLILPGLIDLHLHFPQFDCRGMHAENLLIWLDKYILPIEEKFENSSLARSTAERLLDELVSQGTTTAMFFSSFHAEATDILFEQASKKGVRAIIGKVLMDENVPKRMVQPWRVAIDESIALCKKWHGTMNGRLHYAFSPRFGVTCSERLMVEAGRAAKELNAFVQTHISETEDELDIVRKRFPNRRNYVDVYHSAGLLGERTVLAHAIHCEEEEYKTIAESGTKVAYCPSSNFFLKSGVMSLQKMKNYGITVGLGSDIGAGPSASLFSVMRDGIYMQPQRVRPQEMLSMATIKAAIALGLEKQIGSLDRGKEADFVVVDPSILSGRWKEVEGDLETVLSLLVFRGDAQVVKNVFIKGREVYRSE